MWKWFSPGKPGPGCPPRAQPLKVDIFSRHLQWLRSPDEVAEAGNEMGFAGVDVTVRPYPGHVDPERVAQDLPLFVNAIGKPVLPVREITCPITDADSQNAEAILRTASSLGITHYQPDGKMIYRKEGNVNTLEMRREVVRNLPDDRGFMGMVAYWNSKP
ncbi:MAG TPA: hypothetical protein VML19_34565 [Verrucomicrobiae bacterium]|nr:hypothetical protein [Verrucomicrobiae bacterium]